MHLVGDTLLCTLTDWHYISSDIGSDFPAVILTDRQHNEQPNVTDDVYGNR
jgi:hypothetical protein